MEKIYKTFNIAINNDAEVEEFNKNYNKEIKTTNEQIYDVFDAMEQAIIDCCEGNDWYTDDTIRIKFEVEYVPEDK